MIDNKPKKKKEISRYAILYIIMFIIFGTILSKLLYLQVYKYDEYKEKADTGSTKFISEDAPRGIIYDSEGNILATNTQTYVLTYMQTTESANAIFSTLEKVFSVLDKNGENFEDDLLLKVNGNGEFYFAFKSSDQDVKNATEVLFKSDRGMKDEIVEELYPDHEGDFTDEQLAEINSRLLAISPEDTFYYLVELYGMYNMLLPEDATDEQREELYDKYHDEKGNTVDGRIIVQDLLQKYSLEDIRKYMVVKDVINVQSYQGYKAVTIASNIKKDTAFIFYQMLNELPGISVDLQPVRSYPFGTLASSVLGYVSSINSTEEEVYELKGYDVSSDLVGASGIEAAFEDQLKGKDGGTTVKVNSQGTQTEELFKLESYAGNNVHLTIDKDVQYAAEQALKDTLQRVDSTVTSKYGNGSVNATRGAVVAIEVGTGRVLAMASYPNFNPNDFATGQLSDELYEYYFSPDLESYGKSYIAKTGATASLDELFPINDNGVREDLNDIYPKPMFNYATQGLLPPGSVFKPLTSVAALMDGVITPGTTVLDTGTWVNDELGMKVNNFANIGNGVIGVREALMYSSNYFFYNTGYEMYKAHGSTVEALDSIANYAYKFGLGVRENENPSTGIEIEENFGQTYNFKSWKNRILDTPMFSLVESLKNGNYGAYYFAGFDISKNYEDNEELATLKSKLKEKITNTLALVGTDQQVEDGDVFAAEILSNVKDIMNNSDAYKASLDGYNASRNVNSTIDEQAQIVANALAQYTIYDQATEIRSAAQIVYDAIGQSMNAFTPLQLANYVATLASGGDRYKVRLVDKITSPEGEVIQEFEPEIVDQVNIPDYILQVVKEGMRMVNTYSGNGMAYSSFNNFPIAVCGKTGTADFGSEENYTVIGRRPYGNYISFAPMDNPQIAIFSTLYDGNKGSEGATIHLAIYEAFFKELLETNYKSYTTSSESYQKYVANSPKDNKEVVEGAEQQNEENTNNNSQ